MLNKDHDPIEVLRVKYIIHISPWGKPLDIQFLKDKKM